MSAEACAFVRAQWRLHRGYVRAPLCSTDIVRAHVCAYLQHTAQIFVDLVRHADGACVQHNLFQHGLYNVVWYVSESMSVHMSVRVPGHMSGRSLATHVRTHVYTHGKAKYLDTCLFTCLYIFADGPTLQSGTTLLRAVDGAESCW